MGLLSELEEGYEGTLEKALQQALQDALKVYRPICGRCGLAMQRHHFYPRTILTRHGELSLHIPVFRCRSCGVMTSGMELIGVEEGKQRFSKKSVRRPSA